MNFRITDLQAAIALAQLEKLPGIIQERTEKWEIYQSELSGVGDLQFMKRSAGSTLVPFRFPIKTSKRDQLMQYLEDNHVQTRGFFYPMHLQPQLKEDPVLSLPVAEHLWEQGICLPIHHSLTEKQIQRISHLIKKFFSV
jgi:perosamine synthetase